jgi:sulfur-oxidizing protein SoxZ
MAAEVKIRGRLSNGVAQIKSLMPHPMETGTQRDPDGNLIPAHYIEKVTCYRNDQEVLSADWGASVSKDPYFAFQVKNCSPGDVIRITWVDNKGETSSGELVLK